MSSFFLFICGIFVVYGGEDTIVNDTRLDINTQETPSTAIPVRLFVPPESMAIGPFPAIIFGHGSGGLYKDDDPNEVINENFRRWANLAVTNGFVAIFYDSYTTRGGKSNADSTLIRPYDVYACVEFLLSDSVYIPNGIDSDSIYLIGWSHGGTATLSSMSNSLNNEISYELNINNVIRSAFAFYPGCGMESAYGGISNSLYCPYAPTYILAAELDSLYTGGNCDARIERLDDINCTQILSLNVYNGADHGFDQVEADEIGGKYTQQDWNAREAADTLIWNIIHGITYSPTSATTPPTTAAPVTTPPTAAPTTAAPTWTTSAPTTAAPVTTPPSTAPVPTTPSPTAAGDTIVNSIRLEINTQETPSTAIPVRLFVPPESIAIGPFPAIIFGHGSGGLYKDDDPNEVINENFRRWADLTVTNGFVAIFYDSYTTRGGKSNADATLIRPYDVYACVEFLLSDSVYIPNGVNSDSIYLIGWSNGGTATLSSISSSLNNEISYALNINNAIRAAFAFYPGCGMDSAYGGISKSLYCPYAPTYILAAELDSLYTGGNCDARIERLDDINCTQLLDLKVYNGADGGFDQVEADEIGGKYTQQDWNAREAADAFIWGVINGITNTDPTTLPTTQPLTTSVPVTTPAPTRETSMDDNNNLAPRVCVECIYFIAIWTVTYLF